MSFNKFYNPSDNPLRRISTMISKHTTGYPRRRKIRHMIVTYMTGCEIEKTSKEVPTEKIVTALDIYLPDWRIAEPIIPPQDTIEIIQDLAKEYSFVLSK